MIDWLNQNEGAVTVLVGLGSSAVAIIAILFSWRSAREAQEEQRRANERARLADERANELAYLGVRAEMGALLAISGSFYVRKAGGSEQPLISYSIRNIGKAPAEALEASLDLSGKSHWPPELREQLSPYDTNANDLSLWWQFSFEVPDENVSIEGGKRHVEPPPVLTVIYNDALGVHVQSHGPEAKRRARYDPQGAPASLAR